MTPEPTTGTTGPIAWYRQGSPVQVLFLHGFSDSAACWDPIVAGLAGRWGTLALDARGHGRSGLPAGPAGRAAQAGDAAAVLAAQHDRAAGGVVAVGHSMGAGVALQLARQRPDLVRALFLEDPVLKMPAASAPVSARVRAAGRGWLQEVRALDPAERIARCRAENPTWPDDELAPWSESKDQFDPAFAERPADPADDEPALDVLAALACPVLLLRGDPANGSIVEPAAADAAAEHPNVRVVAVPGVGHSVRREARPLVLAELTAFLGAQLR